MMPKTYGQHLVIAFEALRRAHVDWSDYDPFSKNLEGISGRRHEKDYTIEQLDYEIAQFAIAEEALQQAIAAGPSTIREVNRVLRVRDRVVQIHTHQVSRRKRESHNFESEYNEDATRQRVGQFLNHPQIWEEVTDQRSHRRLLDLLVMYAIHDPLTRVWLAFDRHRYSDVETLIESFRNDDWFTVYLRDVHESNQLAVATANDQACEMFVEVVQTFINAKAQERKRRY